MEQNATARYRELVARLKAGDLAVDFGDLRRSFADSEDYRSGGASGHQAAMYDALGKGDFPAAVKSAQHALDFKYVDLNAHYGLYRAFKEIGEAAKSSFHYAVWRGLIDSIFASGDGSSHETALHVIAVEEEYVILRVLGAVPKIQAFHSEGEHKFDILTVTKLDTQEEATIYFNIDKCFGR